MSDDEPLEADVVLMHEPVDGVPDPVTTTAALSQAARELAAGSGPVAVDAERASGYRYSQRAYLVQLRRAGAGTVLVDPVDLPDLSNLGAALDGPEWILHAANQDLPGLADLGLHPARLFDTELAGRLLGADRVSLGTMVEQYLGIRLEKGHSAADWSVRPLPREWLAYAALDVELLAPLRDVLAEQLEAAGKSEWAKQEFEAVRTAARRAPRDDPWRRTSGIHTVRSRRQLAAVRALWQVRDAYAAERDIAPGRVLPDASIIAAARADPPGAADLARLPVFGGPRQRRNLGRWITALTAARELGEDELPASAGPPDAVPPPARWRDRRPEAADRLVRARAVVAGLAEQHQVLTQNLLASDVVRRIAWEPPTPATEEQIRATLAAYGARPWQITLAAAPLAAALTPA
ncbi:MAG: ribonuclease D [Actinomycetota bacterium]